MKWDCFLKRQGTLYHPKSFHRTDLESWSPWSQHSCTARDYSPITPITPITPKEHDHLGPCLPCSAPGPGFRRRLCPRPRPTEIDRDRETETTGRFQQCCPLLEGPGQPLLVEASSLKMTPETQGFGGVWVWNSLVFLWHHFSQADIEQKKTHRAKHPPIFRLRLRCSGAIQSGRRVFVELVVLGQVSKVSLTSPRWLQTTLTYRETYEGPVNDRCVSPCGQRNWHSQRPSKQ